MQNLPNWVKWLIIITTLVLCVALMAYTNMRNGQVQMPLPDWFASA